LGLGLGLALGSIINAKNRDNLSRLTSSIANHNHFYYTLHLSHLYDKI
jgi:hypothetical protein